MMSCIKCIFESMMWILESRFTRIFRCFHSTLCLLYNFHMPLFFSWSSCCKMLDPPLSFERHDFQFEIFLVYTDLDLLESCDSIQHIKKRNQLIKITMTITTSAFHTRDARSPYLGPTRTCTLPEC